MSAVGAGTASSTTMKRRQFLRPIHLIALQRKAVGEGGGWDRVSVACPASCLQTVAWKLDNSLILANQLTLRLWMSVSLQHSTTIRKVVKNAKPRNTMHNRHNNTHQVHDVGSHSAYRHCDLSAPYSFMGLFKDVPGLLSVHVCTHGMVCIKWM